MLDVSLVQHKLNDIFYCCYFINTKLDGYKGLILLPILRGVSRIISSGADLLFFMLVGAEIFWSEAEKDSLLGHDGQKEGEGPGGRRKSLYI